MGGVKKSYIFGLFLSILAITPPLYYSAKLTLDPLVWLQIVLVSSFIGFLILFHTKIDVILKAFILYVWVSCFYSDSPAISFTAFCFFIIGCLSYLIMLRCNQDIIIRFIEAVFWFEIVLVCMHYFGHDVLMNFGVKYNFINNGSALSIDTVRGNGEFFLGTVRQQMRLGSLMAVMAPFLVYKNKWYIVPVSIAAYFSMSAGFALSVIAGCFTYFFITSNRKMLISAICLLAGVVYFIIDFGSFESAWIDGRFRIWLIIIKTWLFNTAGPIGPPDVFGITQHGPFNLNSFLTGHGLDSFRYLFPVYKHDPNPFAEAHNCWLQLVWECGIIGFGIFAGYFVNLLRRLYLDKEYILLSGLVCIGVNAMSAFPTRMIQTMFMIVAFFALCESKVASTLSSSDSSSS